MVFPPFLLLLPADGLEENFLSIVPCILEAPLLPYMLLHLL